MYLDNSTYYKWVENKTECVLTLFMFILNPNLILVISSTPPRLTTPGWSGSVLLFHGSRVIITSARSGSDTSLRSPGLPTLDTWQRASGDINLEMMIVVGQ